GVLYARAASSIVAVSPRQTYIPTGARGLCARVVAEMGQHVAREQLDRARRLRHRQRSERHVGEQGADSQRLLLATNLGDHVVGIADDAVPLALETVERDL